MTKAFQPTENTPACQSNLVIPLNPHSSSFLQVKPICALPQVLNADMDFETYQTQARLTSQLELAREQDALPALLGLASEIGSILDVYKRYLRDGTDLSASRAFFKEELGDLLWYTAAVATACDLRLQDIAVDNLQKTRNLYPSAGGREDFAGLPVLDSEFPDKERFPRRMVFEFSETPGTPRVAAVRLLEAEPNPFPHGPERNADGKQVGFALKQKVGADLTDNAVVPDAYRFHDALHLGFVGVLGWSPTLRSLLCLKRRSRHEVDDADDGARAIYAEEGLTAVLAHLADDRRGFASEASVDSSTLMVVKAASAGFEVSRLPLWLWRRAIHQGFTVMHELAKNGGGIVKVDLDARTATFQAKP
jgi:hypothetical protein